jgi:crotonobetainyl-CoA hydratase
MITRRGAVLEVVIDRPKANAIDAATSRLMGEAFARLRDDPDLRVGILTGAGGRFFSAGWDLKAAAAGESADADFGVGGFGGIAQLPGLDKPVIAAVNGLAVGGGAEIAVSADLIVMAEHAELAFPEVRRGLVADAACLRLPRRIPHALALELLLTGRRMGAAEARAVGLVNRVVPATRLLEEAHALAAEILKGAPLAVAATKAVIAATAAMTLAQAAEALRTGAVPAYTRVLASEDITEGPRAFAEGREPVWKGR